MIRSQRGLKKRISKRSELSPWHGTGKEFIHARWSPSNRVIPSIRTGSLSLCSASLFDRRTRPSVEVVVVVSIGLLRGIGYIERSRATSSDNFNEKQINKSKELVLPAF